MEGVDIKVNMLLNNNINKQKLTGLFNIGMATGLEEGKLWIQTC